MYEGVKEKRPSEKARAKKKMKEHKQPRASGEDFATLDCRVMPGAPDASARAVDDTLVAGACVLRPVGESFPPPRALYDAWPTKTPARMHGTVVDQPVAVRAEDESRAHPFATYHGLGDEQTAPLARQGTASFVRSVGQCWGWRAFAPSAALAPAEPRRGDDARRDAHARRR